MCRLFDFIFLGAAGRVNLPELAVSFVYMLVVFIIGTVILNQVEAKKIWIRCKEYTESLQLSIWSC